MRAVHQGLPRRCHQTRSYLTDMRRRQTEVAPSPALNADGPACGFALASVGAARRLTCSLVGSSMSLAPERSRGVANQMAGWFYLAVGVILLALAFAVHSRFEVAAWVLGALGASLFAFGVLAPRNLRVSVLETVVTFVMALG